MNRKSFDNLVVKEQGKLPMRGEKENGDQAKSKEDVPSCEHQHQREENQEKEGIPGTIQHRQTFNLRSEL